MFHEAQAIVSAGVETTSWAMSVVMFYLLDNPEIMARLKAELMEIFPDPDSPPSLSELESLPYLTAILYEGRFRIAFRFSA
jgi:cytochrome P450